MFLAEQGIPENINKLKTFRLNCKSKKIPLLVANNIDLMKKISKKKIQIKKILILKNIS